MPFCSSCGKSVGQTEKFCSNCGTKTEWQKASEQPIVLLTCEELEQKFKKGEEKESEILAYMRDMLKIPDFTAFDLINKWRKEINPVQEAPKIDLNQFRG